MSNPLHIRSFKGKRCIELFPVGEILMYHPVHGSEGQGRYRGVGGIRVHDFIPSISDLGKVRLVSNSSFSVSWKATGGRRFACTRRGSRTLSSGGTARSDGFPNAHGAVVHVPSPSKRPAHAGCKVHTYSLS